MISINGNQWIHSILLFTSSKFYRYWTFYFSSFVISYDPIDITFRLILFEYQKHRWRSVIIYFSMKIESDRDVVVFVSRVVASRYFYCLFTVYLYTCASISGTKIFLDGFVKSEPMQPTSLPSAIWSAWLRLIGDTSRTTTVHFHCHRKIWHDLSKSLLRFWHGSV